MKIIYTGLESSGKSLLLAKKAIQLVKRNSYWKKKYGFIRPIYSNLRFSDQFYNQYKELLFYWNDMREIIGKTGMDIIWDEISSDFNSLKREPLSRRINKWLRQGAKCGVEIYASAQEFHDVHLDMRRRISRAYYVTKVIGSPRSGENKPPVNHIWGLCVVRELNIHPYNELQPDYVGLFPSPFFISKDLCSIFNTNQVIDGSREPLLEHIEQKCEQPGCSFSRLIHR